MWKQVQVRVLDDDHNNVIVDHGASYNDYNFIVVHASNNDHDIHAMHDIIRNNHDLVYKDNTCNNINPNNNDTDHDSYDLDQNTL